MNLNVKLSKVFVNNRKVFLNLLLIGDEDEKIVLEYIYQGEMFSVLFEEKIVGAILFLEESENTIELKNISILEEFQRKGIGNQVISYFFEIYKHKYKYMIVGTGDTSIFHVNFYKNLGFKNYFIKKDFFLKYPKPIFENGNQIIDMVMLKRNL